MCFLNGCLTFGQAVADAAMPKVVGAGAKVAGVFNFENRGLCLPFKPENFGYLQSEAGVCRWYANFSKLQRPLLSWTRLSV